MHRERSPPSPGRPAPRLQSRPRPASMMCRLGGSEGAQPPASPCRGPAKRGPKGYAGLGTLRSPSQPADGLEAAHGAPLEHRGSETVGTSPTPRGESVLYSCRGL